MRPRSPICRINLDDLLRGRREVGRDEDLRPVGAHPNRDDDARGDPQALAPDDVGGGGEQRLLLLADHGPDRPAPHRRGRLEDLDAPALLGRAPPLALLPRGRGLVGDEVRLRLRHDVDEALPEPVGLGPLVAGDELPERRHGEEVPVHREQAPAAEPPRDLEGAPDALHDVGLPGDAGPGRAVPAGRLAHPVSYARLGGDAQAGPDRPDEDPHAAEHVAEDVLRLRHRLGLLAQLLYARDPPALLRELGAVGCQHEAAGVDEEHAERREQAVPGLPQGLGGPGRGPEEAYQRVVRLAVEVEYVTDMEKVMAYGAMSMPALVVNEKVVSVGRVLKPAEVEKLLK